MKTWRWVSVAMAAGAALVAQVPEPHLPRPGTVVATQVIGEVTMEAGERTRTIKADERIRVGATLVSGRRSLATFELSNGATLRLGLESELEIEEFGQQPFSDAIKPKEEKSEPTLSITRLRLLRGDIEGEVKPLNVLRGSSFTVTSVAGRLRIVEGKFRMSVRMTELGLGLCTVELTQGSAEFEPLGGNFAPLPPGKPLLLALETDRASGHIKVSEMPKGAEAPQPPK